MRPRIVATLISEGVSIDALTNRLTIFNSLESVVVQNLPALLQRLMVVVIYELGEACSFIETVTILEPDGQGYLKSEAAVNLPARGQNGPVAHRSMHALWGVKFEKPGEFAVRVTHRVEGEGAEKEVARRSFLVSKAPYPFFPPQPAKPT